jgi:hypothetical protein
MTAVERRKRDEKALKRLQAGERRERVAADCGISLRQLERRICPRLREARERSLRIMEHSAAS